MKSRSLALLLLLTACGGTTPPAADGGSDGGSDAGHDAGFCSDGDGGLVAAPAEVCDGIDNDCNGVVDDGPGIELLPYLHVDADHDGLGDLHQIVFHQCVRPGFVLPPVDVRFDCDDGDPSAPPGLSPTCDEDGDGYLGAVDCDDTNAALHPGATEMCNSIDDDCDGLVDDADTSGAHDPTADYVLDEDGDGAFTGRVFACADPGPGYVALSARLDWVGADCAPLDPRIRPDQPDDCATQTDVNCDGVYSPVYGGPTSFADAFLRAGPSDPPTTVFVESAYGAQVALCPGTYRVVLTFSGTSYCSASATVAIRGLGASPADVVIDAVGAGANVSVFPPVGLDCGTDLDVNITNLTLANGNAAEGGCLNLHPSFVWASSNATLDHVVLRGCRADLGGAIYGDGSRIMLTDTVFDDVAATSGGGAIALEGSRLSMTRGGFTNTIAPAAGGGAIWANFTSYSLIDLVDVDLSGVTNDVFVNSNGTILRRDLGAHASLHCDVATGCTP